MNDLISRQEAIDALRNLARDYFSVFDERYNVFLDALCKADKAIRALPSVQSEQKWISVKEQMPEEEVDVLICNKDGNIALSRGSYSTETKDCWIWYTSGWRFGKVKAWMPLPEPPKGETE